jgi:hypothetical protein
MKRSREAVLAAGLIAVTTLLTYGVLIGQLGFYRDDWYLLSTAQSQGTAGVIALFQIDRPLVGYLYAAMYGLLGMSPLGWQVSALLMRLAGNLAFLWLLRLIWPRRTVETTAIALLFSVYPGFTVEPNAGVYVTDLMANALALLSFGLMVKAVRSSRRLAWLVLSATAGLLELLYLGIFESAIGLEIARLALVWYLIWRKDRTPWQASALPALKADSLYLLLGFGFLVWRLFIFQSSRRATNLSVLVGRYQSLPVRSALAILVETTKDIIETAFLAWAVPFYQATAATNYRDLAIAVLLGLLLTACTFIVLRSWTGDARQQPPDPGGYSHLHAIVLGGVAVVFALLPIDLAGRNVLFSDQWDRYTIYASAGVALLVGGIVFHFLSGSAARGLLLILVGSAVIVHYFSAAWYRDFWASERDLWQQMVWRAPGLNRGTMLFLSLPNGGYQEGYEIYGPANMVYYPGQSLQLGGDVLNPATAANIQLQKNRQHYDRSVLVEDNYKSVLMGVFPAQGSCLHVLDGRQVELPGLIDDSLVPEVASYSKIDLIRADARPAALPNFLEGAPTKPWCRFYQKMELARQQADWPEVARLADVAQAQGLAPEDVSEWMPALEAYASTGQLQAARHAASIIRSVDTARAYLCLQLQRGPAYPAPYDYNLVNQVLCQANQ